MSSMRYKENDGGKGLELDFVREIRKKIGATLTIS